MSIDMTSAIPPAGSVGATELADEAVTTAKIAADAVTTAKISPEAVLEADVADGSITAAKLAASAVTVDKIAAGAVSTAKIADGAVTPDKASKATRRGGQVMNSNEVSEAGLNAAKVVAKQASFSKTASGAGNYTDIAVCLAMKSTATHTAYADVYLDAEASPRATVSTAATAYDSIASSDVDISDLGLGQHTIKLVLRSSDAGGTAYLRETEIHFIQGA